MVKLTIANLSSKAGFRVDVQKIDELNLSGRQLDQLALSFAPFANLHRLDLSNNRFQFERQLDQLWSAPVLKSLCITGNPICNDEHFRTRVIARLIDLEQLDDVPVTIEDRAAAWAQFPEFKPVDVDRADVATTLVKAQQEERIALATQHVREQQEQESLAQLEETRRQQLEDDKKRVARELQQKKERDLRLRKQQEKLVAEARSMESSSAIVDQNPAPAPEKTVRETNFCEPEKEVREILSSVEKKATAANKALLFGKPVDESSVKPSLFGRGQDIFAGDVSDSSDDDDVLDSIFGSRRPAASGSGPEPVAEPETNSGDDDLFASLKPQQDKSTAPVAKPDTLPLPSVNQKVVVDDDLFGSVRSAQPGQATSEGGFSFADKLSSMLQDSESSKSNHKSLFDD